MDILALEGLKEVGILTINNNKKKTIKKLFLLTIEAGDIRVSVVVNFLSCSVVKSELLVDLLASTGLIFTWIFCCSSSAKE